MYSKCTLFYKSPKNWGITHIYVQTMLYQASPRGGGGGAGNEAKAELDLLWIEGIPSRKTLLKEINTMQGWKVDWSIFDQCSGLPGDWHKMLSPWPHLYQRWETECTMHKLPGMRESF